MQKNQVTAPAIARTAEGLREHLFVTLDELKSGKRDAHYAAAVAKVTVQIINVITAEVGLRRMAGANGAGAMQLTALPKLTLAGEQDANRKPR